MQSTKQESDFETMSTDTKHILGIVGSPRKCGNTDTLVDSVLAGAAQYGAVSEKVILNDLSIAPCRACNHCQKGGKCIQEDDMVHLIERMERSDIWVLGTPIYWWGPRAQLKIFIDRWYGLNPRIFQGKRIVLTIPMGGEDSHYAQHTVGMITDICNYLGIELIDSVIATGMNGRNSVRESSRMLETARATGIKIMNTK